MGRDDASIPAKAVEVYKKGLAKKVILLGGRGRLTGGIVGSESEAFKKYLLAQDVPEKLILMEENSTNTGENIIEGLNLIKDDASAKNISIITHGSHTRRVMAVAKSQNPSIVWSSCPDGCRLPQIHLP